MFIYKKLHSMKIDCLQKCMQCKTDRSAKCLVAKNSKGLTSRCQTCKRKQKWCTVLQEKPNIQQGRTVLHRGGSWDHLVVKLHVKFKSPEMVPDDTSDEAEGSSLVPAAGEEDVKGKEKEKIP